MANLKKLHSFSYALVMSRTEPPQISGSFAGSVFLPDTQEQVGNWAGQPHIHTKSRGNAEYSRLEAGGAGTVSGADTFWTVNERDEEGSLLGQVERVLALDSFRSVGQKGGFREYSFVPNLPFLDPSLSRKLEGRFRVVQGRDLPADISVTSPDRVISWQVRFADFNRAPAVAFPFVRQWRVGLMADSTRAQGPGDSGLLSAPSTHFLSGPAASDSALLWRRLRAMGFESQSVRSGDTLVLFLERDLSEDVLRALARRGHAEVWIGRELRPGTPVPESAPRVFLPPNPDDVSSPGRAGPRIAVLERRQFADQDLARVSLADSAGERALTLILSSSAQRRMAEATRLANSGMLWILTIDRNPIGIATIDKAQGTLRLEPGGLLNLPQMNALAAILASGPLSRQYRIATRTRVR